MVDKEVIATTKPAGIARVEFAAIEACENVGAGRQVDKAGDQSRVVDEGIGTLRIDRKSRPSGDVSRIVDRRRGATIGIDADGGAKELARIVDRDRRRTPKRCRVNADA